MGGGGEREDGQYVCEKDEEDPVTDSSMGGWWAEVTDV